MILLDQSKRECLIASPSIKVIGIGGAGGNTVNSMIDHLPMIEFFVANTDAQALSQSRAHHTIQLGSKATKGLGTGANPDLGKRAAQESLDTIIELLEGAHVVFLTGGMGGGTGSGGLPVIAQALKEMGILTIAVVTKPFLFEGKRRAAIAQQATAQLATVVDTLIVVPNQQLLGIVDAALPMMDAFAIINQFLTQSVKGISDIISRPGHINVDFADVNVIMKNMGYAVMGTGTTTGHDRALKAAHAAINSPLLENMSIAGAQGVLINITGGPDLTLHEINTAASIIYEQVDPEATIILGSVIDPAMENHMMVTVIATGIQMPQGHDAIQETVAAAPQSQTPSWRSHPSAPPTKDFLNESHSSRHHYTPAASDKDAQPKIITPQIHHNANPLNDNNYDNQDHLDIPTFMRAAKPYDTP